MHSIYVYTDYQGIKMFANSHTHTHTAFAVGFSEMRWKTQRDRKNAYDDIKMCIIPKQKCG